VTHKVTFAPAAFGDLAAIYDWIADEAGDATATSYRDRLMGACFRLAEFPNRGSKRDDVLPGVRTITFERRALIVYMVEPDEVVITRVLHHGRDLRRALHNG
jgi:toxin ParE1/3/4